MGTFNNTTTKEQYRLTELRSMSAMRMAKIDTAEPATKWSIYYTKPSLFAAPEIATENTETTNVSADIAGAVIDSAVKKDEQVQTVFDMQLDRFRKQVEESYEPAA